ncbi:MAG: hypothetical protein A2279_12440 [Stygiobacter sp. RIFOXYA12_FULL_38_9]|nr:MAG: hypothetical protein A2279_12440 [Stygiobacter sp. RIFOXYA12_FULL_38_9]OGV13179.1 MAG: hypothetical protein A2440_12680 [Stygiobacter sp. RIFOXYC2_FULL_38_25]OGV83225.1 MAG: hypothetical protein A2X65_16235 [Stygiobacter sp. GWF2_38_21]RJQ58654.1 MAG: hypothetical protein C4517_14745 [Stygiobacter sp.]
MRPLSFIIILLLSVSLCNAQSPHGDKFKRDCQDCHTVDGWTVIPSKILFNHSETGFELKGQHQTVQCRTCHSSLVFSESKGKANCSDCHTDIHTNTVGKNCARCHNNKTWIIENITDLHRTGKFPLLGNHAKADCRQCHKAASSLKFEPIGIRCYDCHIANYNATKDPNHIQANFSTDCQQCHNFTAASWSATSIIHDFFPLSGAHNISDCFSCHTKGSYKGLSQDCYSCHQKKYESTTSPNHVVLNFAKDCKQCHSISVGGWKPATFANHDLKYPLVGAHNTIRNDCSKCHATGYNQTARQCVSCHQQKYDSAINPNHKGAQFSTDCASCHSQTAWKPATFDHDGKYFPIYSGEHKGEWSNCSDCHLDQTNYKTFECTNCHEHNKSDMDKEHQGVNGYAYQSRACYACHPSGTKQGGINHSLTKFPLIGAHTTVPCTQCHQTTYAGTPTECVSCHQAKFAAAPNHSSQNYPQDCKQCHTPVDWKTINFNHSTTRFPLLGSHTTVKCNSCHTTTLTGTPTTCYSCHQAKFASAPNHVSQGYPQICEQCHNTTDWKSVTFNHATTKFPLTGSHVSVTCNSCHSKGYVGTPTDCYSCHQAKYTSAPEHVAKAYPQTCEQCHSTTNWASVTFNHATTKFPLLGSHTTVKCSSCHTSGFAGTPTECVSCHQANFTAAPNHTSQNYPQDCKQCHTPVDWKTINFNHSTTKFPLLGSHTTVKCGSCHTTTLTGTPTTCYSCHQAKFTSAPNHVSQGYPQTCEQCHNTTDWKTVTFNHATTKFPLTGSHVSVTCNSCHSKGYVGTPTDCYSCHQAKYTSAPEHVAKAYPQTCEQCHSTTNWSSVTFNHAATKFPLLGSHTTVKCNSCHTTVFAGTPTECVSCHQANFTAAPNHTAQNYPQDCKQCHTPVDWKTINFNHSTTKFPLLGSHTTVKCGLCHTTTLTGTPTTCYSCHQAKYSSAPEHVAKGYPQTCEQCHNTTNWSSVTFNHAATKFPLLGSHTTVKCNSCHTTVFAGTPTECVSCHQANFTAAPNHTAQNYSQDCKQCHTPVDWKTINFNHSTTKFPLLGSHTTVKCNSCHTTTLTGTPTTCYSCHQAKFTAAPNHVAQGYPQTCEQCHNTTDWKSVTFNHATTKFPLTGAHVSVICNSCHSKGYVGTPTDCYSCHQAKYTSAPEHVAKSYPTDCKVCHTTTTWQGAVFNHSTTAFPLTGAHISVTCASCHTTTFKGTPTACSSCHTTKYQSTTNPNHALINIPVTCEQCHTTNPGWKPATFPIHNNYYQILGAHLQIANQCSNCHAGNYNTKHSGCVSCHLTQYNQVTNPNHATAKFPLACEQCHTQNVWKPSTFNHDGQYFPIYSGEHRGEWSLCTDCHTNQSNYKVFECINCHEHNKTDMDKEHQGKSGYLYQSTACYNCHPNGKS